MLDFKVKMFKFWGKKTVAQIIIDNELKNNEINSYSMS